MTDKKWQGEVTEKLASLERQFTNHLHHHFIITSGCFVAAVGQLLVIAWFVLQKVLSS